MNSQNNLKENSLTDRQHAILSAVIQHYILTAEPVGSRTLSKLPRMGLSPASIRNVMSDLEEAGYLNQPHTSAGRIPTDKGYRYYVNHIMRQAELTNEEKTEIQSSLAYAHEVDEILEIASRALGKVTHQLGVALSPRFEEGVFKKIDFMPLSSEKVLLALALQSGMVKTMTVEIGTALSTEKLVTVCSVLNERFSGKKISEIRSDMQKSLSILNLDEKDLGTIRLFLPSVEHLFESAKQANLHTAGIPVALSQPEFLDKSLLQAVIELLENKTTLIHLLGEREKGSGIYITIGGENEAGQFKSFSIVTSNYRMGNLRGTLGVIGPTRMPYSKLISAVDYTVKVVEEKQLHI